MVTRVEDSLPQSRALALETSSSDAGTLFLLGAQETKEGEQLIGLAGAVGWHGADPTSVDHVELVQGSLLSVPRSDLYIHSSQNVTLTLRSPAVGQFIVRVHAPVVQPTTLTMSLPWESLPKQVNVWRGAHVWHVTNSSLNPKRVADTTVTFEAMPGLDYLIERFCIRSKKAGYGDGKGGWLCDPGDPYFREEL